jgi:hypothetical protein
MQALFAVVAPCWAGEAEIVNVYFSRPRTRERDRFWLRARAARPTSQAYAARARGDADRDHRQHRRSSRDFCPAPKDVRLRSELAIAPDQVVVGHFSNLAPNKRPLDIVASARVVLRAAPRVPYLVAGTGALRAEMEARVRESALAGAFRFVGETRLPGVRTPGGGHASGHSRLAVGYAGSRLLRALRPPSRRCSPCVHLRRAGMSDVHGRGERRSSTTWDASSKTVACGRYRVVSKPRGRPRS